MLYEVITLYLKQKIHAHAEIKTDQLAVSKPNFFQSDLVHFGHGKIAIAKAAIN